MNVIGRGQLPVCEHITCLIRVYPLVGRQLGYDLMIGIPAHEDCIYILYKCKIAIFSFSAAVLSIKPIYTAFLSAM